MSARLVLSILILLGLLAGLVCGQLLFDPHWHNSQALSTHKNAAYLQLAELIGNTLFMGLLKMFIMPLIATSVIVGVTSIGDFRELGKLGAITLLYYFSTMLIAVVLGLILVNLIVPGMPMRGLVAADAPPQYKSEVQAIASSAPAGVLAVFDSLLKQLIPQNFLKALVDGSPLPLIFFSMFLGIVVTTLGKQGEVVISLAQALFEALMRMITVVLWIAPLGVFCLLLTTVAKIGLDVFGGAIGSFMFTVLLGLAVHALVILPLLLSIFGRCNPFLFMHQMRQALMTAFATDSSSATLPVTIECATDLGGVHKRAAGLVLPLGSTINMDGTALYEAVAVVFLAQAYQIELGMTQMVLIAITATLAAVGAAGIPSAGLITMVIVIDAVNKSLTALDPNAATIPVVAIGLIIGVDRLLDMFRTTVNVWGDAVGAKIVSGYVKD